MPASSWARPPYASARPKTIGSARLSRMPLLNMLRTNVVSANAASPRGPGSATLGRLAVSRAAASARCSAIRPVVGSRWVVPSAAMVLPPSPECSPPVGLLPAAASATATTVRGLTRSGALLAFALLGGGMRSRRRGLGDGLGLLLARIVVRLARGGAPAALRRGALLAHLGVGRPRLRPPGAPGRRRPARPAIQQQPREREQPQRLQQLRQQRD